MDNSEIKTHQRILKIKRRFLNKGKNVPKNALENLNKAEDLFEQTKKFKSILRRLNKKREEISKAMRKLLSFSMEINMLHNARRLIYLSNEGVTYYQEQNKVLKNAGEYAKAEEALNEVNYCLEVRKRNRKEAADLIRKIRRESRRLLKGVYLTDHEKRLLEEYKDIPSKLERTLIGLRKQVSNVHSGMVNLIYRISEGDSKAIKEVEKHLGDFISAMLRFYRRRLEIKSKRGKNEFMSSVELAIFEAVRDFNKNKYLSVKEWLRGRISRSLKELMIEEYQRNAKVTILEEGIEEFPDSNENYDGTDEEIRGIISQKIKVKPKIFSKNKLPNIKDEKIWINDAADRVGVDGQTLRNWDLNGTYPARWQSIKGKEYRYYLEEDIQRLLQIKWKREGAKKRRLKTVAKIFKVSYKTLVRWEENGSIPFAPRDSNGRFYPDNLIKKISLIKKINITT